MFTIRKKKEEKSENSDLPEEKVISDTMELLEQEEVGRAEEITESDVSEQTDSFERWLDERGIDGERKERSLSVYRNLRDADCDKEDNSEIFEIVLKGVDYDSALKEMENREQLAVIEAESRGEVRGRNAAIEEMVAKETQSDGLPHLGPSSGVYSSERGPSIFELARGARED